MLLTGESGLAPAGGFALDVGATWIEPSPFRGGDYVLPITALRADDVNDPLFMYLPSQRARITGGESLGDVYEPYFDRTSAHFSGHRNTPNRPAPSGYPSGVRHGRVVWLAHPIFTAYRHSGASAILSCADKALRLALGARPLIETSLPRAGRATLRQQPAEGRSVLHLLHANPVLRGDLEGDTVQVIQDITPLYDVHVSITSSHPVAAARLVPQDIPLEITEADGRVQFTVPLIEGHQMIELT